MARVRVVVGLVGLAATFVAVGAPRAAQAKPVPCPPGRFLAAPASQPLLPGVSPATDAIGLDAEGRVALDGCGPAMRAKVKAARRFTRITARWSACGSFTKVALSAKVAAPGCGALSGRIKARKAKRKAFSAARSTCGDARVDSGGGEECDAGQACAGGAVCSGSCTCPLPATTTTTTIATTTTTTLVCVDADGDGWTGCDGDCCDGPAGCPSPALVNPGAFEVAANEVDDDCDGATDVLPASCDGGLASDSSAGLDYAKAIDLCRTTTENPPTPAERTWGVIDATLRLADGTSAPATASRSIRSAFGANTAPLSGAAFAVLSSGTAAAPGQTNPSHASFQSYDAGTSSPAPADWLTANGGTFPNAPGCPAPSGTTANDPVMLRVRVRVPTNARSFSVASTFHSAEYPEWVCSPFNDVFLVLLDSSFVPGDGEAANPADKNLAVFSSPGGVHPVGVNLAYGDTGLFTQCVNGPTGCATGAQPGTTTTCTSTSGLAGTGFDLADPGNCDAQGLVGGATGWLVTSGNVTPGETIEVRFVIWDTADHAFDSLVLLDGWTWSTGPVTPGTGL